MTAPIVLGIPCVSWMYTRAAVSLFRIFRDELPPGSGTIVEDGYASWIAKRNSIVQAFLTAPAAFQHLLLLDSDMIFPAGMIARLLAAGKHVIGVPYTMRFPPFPIVGGTTVTADDADYDPARRPMPYSPAEFGNGLQRVSKIGGGVMLIQRRVLETMRTPWFYAPPEYKDADDYWFCEQAEAAGFEIWMDTDIEVGHMTIGAVTPANAPHWRNAWEGQ